MATRSLPITISLAVSALLHGAALFAYLPPMEVAGKSVPGLTIDLLAAQTSVSRHASDVAKKQPREQQVHKPKANKRVIPAVIHAGNRDDAFSADAVTVAAPAETTQLRVAQTRSQSTKSSVAENNNGQRDALLEMLHKAIDEHKRYPYLAKRQRREGTVRVGFAIETDGRVNQLSVVDSSRSLMLDEAALAAVTQIQPFAPAQAMLDRRQEFQVDIVFSML